MAQPAQALQATALHNEDWKSKLKLPAKDPRIQTEVDLAACAAHSTDLAVMLKQKYSPELLSSDALWLFVCACGIALQRLISMSELTFARIGRHGDQRQRV